nr:uncharacterized protein LOC113806318 [Penaeus vannamei]
MGKVNNKASVVSQRRRFLKASSGVGGKKGRGSSKVSLPPPPSSQSLVLDEDSGFGGDQSLDSESSLLSSPGSATLSSNSATSAAAAAATSAAVAAAASAATLPSVLPSLTMVPQTKLLLVSLLQGGGVVQGTPTSQKSPGNVAVGAYPPTTQPTISNGTSQTGNTHGAVTTSGADKEWNTSHSVRPLLAAASLSHGGSSVTDDVVSELPAASTTTTFPSNCPPTGPVALGNAGHKVGTFTPPTLPRARADLSHTINTSHLFLLGSEFPTL